MLVGSVGLDGDRARRARRDAVAGDASSSTPRAPPAPRCRACLRATCCPTLPGRCSSPSRWPLARSILLESTLSFFGVGVQPPAASWGNMLYQAQTTMSTEPWLAFFPGVFIFATTLSVNVVGDELARPKL